MNQHESWYPVENSRFFFYATNQFEKMREKKEYIGRVCIFHMHRLFFSRQIFIYFFLNWKYLNQQIEKRLAKHTTKLKSLLIYVDIFDFFFRCAVSIRHCVFCRYVAFNKVCVILFSISFNRWWSWLQIDLEKNSMFY